MPLLSQDVADRLPPSKAWHRAQIVLIGLIFCVSGAAALVYQVAWQRILVLHSGVGIYSVAMITAGFLAGLGIGSQIGGIRSAEFSARTALRVFALLELLVALFGFVSCSFYYDLLYIRMPWLYANFWTAGVCHFLTLLVPTAAMGMSLPFLVRAMVSDKDSASGTIGYLYGVNVLGAAAGAFLAPWILIRFLGIRGAVASAAGANVVAGLMGLALSLRFGSRAAESPRATLEQVPEEDGGKRLGLWMVLYALSGFCALALEVTWFRLVEVAVKATAFTFGTVLAIYLLGVAGGSLAGVGFVRRLQRPLKVFLACQSFLVTYTLLIVFLLVRLPVRLPGYIWFVRYWARNRTFILGTDWDSAYILRLYLLLPALLFAVPTILMGMSFVILQRAIQDDPRVAGRRVGVLQACNIAGNVTGSLFAGLFSLRVLGTAGTLRVVAVCGLFFALVGSRHFGFRWLFGPVGAALVALLALTPSQSDLWSRLHGLEKTGPWIEEDSTGVAAILPWTPDHWQVWVNGRRHSWLPFGGIHSVLGALPAIIHPNPRDVAIVGLGSGDTAWASACRNLTQSVTVFEIVEPLASVLRRFDRPSAGSRLSEFLQDPRVHIAWADGRNALARGAERYDIVQADPLHPESAYSANLYSVEFFRLAGRRLKPHGLMTTWAATPRVYATFCGAFPHVLEFDSGQILVGSNEPIAVDPSSWTGRLSGGAKGYLGPRVSSEILRVLPTWKPCSPSSLQNVEPNHDLFPRDEFRTPPRQPQAPPITSGSSTEGIDR